MFFYEGYVCPVCKQKFQEADDIVACPECGAPHHRDCWMQTGHCCFADDHGTSRQWKRPGDPSANSVTDNSSHTDHAAAHLKFCPRCGHQNLEFSEFCSRCGQNLSAPDWNSSGRNASSANGSPRGDSVNPHGSSPYGGYSTQGYGEYAPFHMPVIDPYGGVPHEEIIKDVTAEELVAYVGPGSSFYLPRFRKIAASGSHASWNWPAFLFPQFWLLYRKNYLAGSLILLLSLIETFLTYFIYGTYIQPSLDLTSETAMLESLDSLIKEGSLTIFFTILTLVFLISLIVRVLLGLMGNYLYMRTSLSRIHTIHNKHSEMQQGTSFDSVYYHNELSENGGVSLVLVAVASGIVWFGQLLVQALFFY